MTAGFILGKETDMGFNDGFVEQSEKIPLFDDSRWLACLMTERSQGIEYVFFSSFFRLFCVSMKFSRIFVVILHLVSLPCIAGGILHGAGGRGVAFVWAMPGIMGLKMKINV